MVKKYQILNGDVRTVLQTLPEKSVQCVVTSPPYWGLRDYGTGTWEGGDVLCQHSVGGQVADTKWQGAITTGQRPGVDASCCKKCGARRVDNQLGLEPTPEAYVEKLVEVFREVKRVLRDDGTVWLNLGDSYASVGKWGGSSGGKNAAAKKSGAYIRQRKDWGECYRGGHSAETSGKHGPRIAAMGPMTQPNRMSIVGLKSKDLIGIPWRVAFALQADGWYLRSDIIWHKPNVMPESVTDRPTRAHEYLFLLTKSANYFYDADAIKEPVDKGRLRSKTPLKDGGPKQFVLGNNRGGNLGDIGPATRNKRSVWRVNTQPFKGAHFATFPEKLIAPCILAGTSAHGACASCGAPWKRVVKKGAPNLEHQIACGGDATGAYTSGGIKDYESAGVQNPSAVKARILAGMVEKKTVGWKPTCKCDPHHIARVVPCISLDPFCGSGTTGVVALKHHQQFIGIELNPEYADMARTRIDDSIEPSLW